MSVLWPGCDIEWISEGAEEGVRVCSSNILPDSDSSNYGNEQDQTTAM